MSRISNIETWARLIMRFCPIAANSQEMVKFDMQAMDNPQIEAAQYQQGTLAGYEVREYLLLKWGHKCTYCLAHDVPLQVEHIVSRARGGSNRVSNLCLACSACNSKKGTQDIRDFLKQEPELLDRIKYVYPLHIKAVGTGSRQMCRMDRFGFPRTGPKQAKRVKGFQTGDVVRAIIPSGKNAGTYVGRVAVRTMGAFNITTAQRTVQGISHRFCTVLHHCDGYSYIYERRPVFALASRT